MALNAAGAYATKCAGNRSDSAGGAAAITAAGAFSVKATNINIEGKAAVTLIAGSSLISLTAAGIVTVMGTSIKVDGDAVLPQPLHKSN